ncbi:MAG TPA: PaaI family thioesterase [Dehalococcoidia bacterium]|jgi:acyl-coenzyme A thioesterase PaaI-like protein
MNENQSGRGVMCFACGAENERGLHMQFSREGERAVCLYTPCAYQQGYPARMHGGIVSTLLDEAMGWAVYNAARWGATARLNIRFRRPVPLDNPLRIEAWIVNDRSRLIELRAEMRDTAGLLLAEADGSFMKLDGSMSAEMSGLAREAGRGDAPIV